MTWDELFFAFMITVFGGIFFLVMLKMILNFFKDRRRSQDASLGATELEAMIQRAVEAGTASLHDRIDGLEQQLAAESRALPARAATLLDEVIDPEDSTDLHERRRPVRSR